MFENRAAIQRQSKKFKRFQHTQPFEMLHNENNKNKLKSVNKCNSNSTVNSINYNRATTVVSSFNSSASDMSACRSPSSSSSSSSSSSLSSSCFTTGSSSSPLLCSRRPFASSSPSSSVLSSLSSPSSSSSSSSLSSSLLSDESLAPAADQFVTTSGDISVGSSNYFADEQVFYNLILKERAELERRNVQQQNQNHQPQQQQQQQLTGQLRHMLLSWMLKVCEHQLCQDEIFPLATMILEKFLALNPIVGGLSQIESSAGAHLFDSECEENNNNNVDFAIRATTKRRHQQQLLDVSYQNNYHYFCYEDASGGDGQHPRAGGNRAAAGATSHSTAAACVFDLDSNLNSVDLNKLHPISQHQHEACQADGDRQGAAECGQEHEYTANGDHDHNGRRQEGGRALLFECNEHNVKELEQRQLCLFAVCSLLLATKMRQTARLCVQTLIEFSRLELPLELTRDEILDGELLMLSVLKWDLAALVAPNDFLIILTRKCQKVLCAFLASQGTPIKGGKQTDKITSKTIDEQRDVEQIECQHEHEHQHQQRHHHQHHHHNNNTNSNNNNNNNHRQLINRCAESRVRQHTQTLLELCLMDSHISQYSPSILAMASMAVAIDGLSTTEKNCWRLNEIVTQIHESTNKVNDLKLMIEVAFQIEKYVQKLLHSTHDD